MLFDFHGLSGHMIFGGVRSSSLMVINTFDRDTGVFTGNVRKETALRGDQEFALTGRLTQNFERIETLIYHPHAQFPFIQPAIPVGPPFDIMFEVELPHARKETFSGGLQPSTVIPGTTQKGAFIAGTSRIQRQARASGPSVCRWTR